MQKTAFVTLFLLLFMFSLSSAHGETTTTAVTAIVGQNNVPVNSTDLVRLSVLSSGGYLLIVGIVNSTGNYTQGSIVEMAPNALLFSCNNSSAVCDIWTSGNSSTISLLFSIQVPPSRGDWKFEAIASLAEGGRYVNINNLTSIQSTVSRYPFTIHVYDTANVMINVPGSVTAEFDGVQKSPGSFQVSLAVGSNHSLTIPAVIQINETSRFSFVGWRTEAGYGVQWVQVPSNASSPNQSFEIRILGDANLTASYMLQYKVNVTNFLPTGSGYALWCGYGQSNGVTVGGLCGYGSAWYPASSPYPYVFSTMTSPQPASGILGQVGVREFFEGWYVNGEYVSNSTDLTITISHPLMIEARWHTDYTLFIVIFSAIIIEAVAIIFMSVRAIRARTTKSS
jgi:hypothetical protein